VNDNECKDMSGFSFPPPPPPPPRAATDGPGTHQVQYGSQTRGGRGRAGNRGGNRDAPYSRGRGSDYHSQNFGHPPRNDAGSHPGAFGGPHISSVPSIPSQTQGAPQGSFGPLPLPNLPAGAYINPNFASHRYISTQFATTSDRSSNTAHNTGFQPSESPSRNVAGHKRKLEALRGPQQDSGNRSGLKPAPAVPRFGASILPPKPHPQQPRISLPKAKLASNALGLTPGDAEPEYPSSADEAEDNDVDEEAEYAELGAKLTFEHNGTVMSLNSTADLAAWRNERKQNWPTKMRMAEKEASRREIGEKRKRLLAKASLLHDCATKRDMRRAGGDTKTSSRSTADERPTQDGDRTIAAVNIKPETKLESAKRELGEQAASLEALRKRVASSGALLEKAKASQAEESNEIPEHLAAAVGGSREEPAAHDRAASDDASNLLSESSAVSSDSSSAVDSDEDEPPEETSSKTPVQSAVGSAKPVCKYFTASGYCRDGDACRFRHELPARGSAASLAAPLQQPSQPRRDPAPKLENVLAGDKRSISERLMEQQEREEDRLALQVIKHLGKVGFLDVRDAEDAP